jgi:hypothetical protein
MERRVSKDSMTGDRRLLKAHPLEVHVKPFADKEPSA